MSNQISLKEITDTIDSTFYEYVEDGYCAEEIEESRQLQKINNMIEELYDLLTPKKREQLEDDLDTIHMNVKEKIESIVEDALISYRRRLQANIKASDTTSFVHREWLLNPKLADRY